MVMVAHHFDVSKIVLVLKVFTLKSVENLGFSGGLESAWNSPYR